MGLSLVFDWWKIFVYNYILYVCVATDGTNNYLYDQLWKLCAGPLFDPQKIGEEVYYFPHGHIEQAITLFFKIIIYFHLCFDFHNLLKIWWYYQLVTSINDELCQLKPVFNIPSKIRCNVFSIKLKVCFIDYLRFLFSEFTWAISTWCKWYRFGFILMYGLRQRLLQINFFVAGYICELQNKILFNNIFSGLLNNNLINIMDFYL